MTSIIGVDIGTSSCKCAIYDTDRSELVALASKGYPLETPEPGRVELDPELVLEKTLWVIQKAVMQASPLGDTVSAIGIAGAAHSLLAVDTKGKPLTRCITNLDTRAVSETVWLQEEIGSVHRAPRLSRYSPAPARMSRRSVRLRYWRRPLPNRPAWRSRRRDRRAGW